ncbi:MULTISPECIES: FAD-binding and (Fe-S)-binding domain-containing protein [unclassified Streptomyces]|uniref:FAD-binding and (Fe-S)-binding domain-containing protein n=1 Tax=unclassified Streptomyces TaxID=2593676 RepID=UPI000F6E74E4|nr:MULTISPECIES: FAD-binding and (Fe-S)-binding domain-containing protein [unclassified Streptomyces]AZM61631.1 FAD-binding oxidoreductase [Streptomyces sp. WAC 01438]RSN01318.1 FAD-binding oxidoreductase [Streptomyces sp. WAC 01420]
MTDHRELSAGLRAAVRGEVDFGTAARALTTMDASNYRRVPLGVVAPRDADDVAAVLAVCRSHGVPVVPRGGGTSIAGQATGTGVVLDFTRHMNRLLSLDPQARTAVVQPGLVLDRLQEAAAPHGLRFGPDPSTHSRCTLGGMIGNNSCGSHSVAWGTTADNVRELSVLTPRGERLRPARAWAGAPAGLRELVDGELARLRTGFPDLPRRISGYAVDALLPERGADVARSFCGSEGTLGVLTEAVVDLVPAPRARALAVLAYADESGAAEAAAGLLEHGPLTVEGMAADLVPAAAAADLPRGGAWLFVETGGDTGEEARARAGTIVRAADVVDSLIVTDPARQRALWRIREDASGRATRLPGGTSRTESGGGSEAWPGWEDCAVPPARLGAYLRDFRALLAGHGLRGTPYGHFGDGCIHVRIDFDLLTGPGIARFRRFSEELADLVVSHGGSLSGEHGDGQARAELLPRMYGPETVALFERVKAVWDPDDLLNPGMLVRPAPLDADLRFSVLPREPVDVAFGYPADGGDFSAAVRRCVGVAKCRTTSVSGPAVMCPSFRATGEEQHSTRGRARLLHEMLAGELVTDGWRSTEVRDALDLCLSCKGCRSDCPVEVDMATYKAEFLHHHYAGRRRPAAHYAMGWLPVWLRLVARTRTAGVLNTLASVAPLARAAKRLGGIAREREIPRVAGETFTRWWRGRPDAPRGKGTTVLLWPDTFTEHLSPSVGRAAVRVLEAAGLRVVLPPTLRPARHRVGDARSRSALSLLTARRARVCCGLTYISTGQLDRARAVLRRTLDLLEPVLDTDMPVVVLEPSCAAALRTDAPELLHDDPRAARLAARVRTFAETLERHAPHWTPPALNRPVTGQTHCHQHAVLGEAPDRRLREAAGLTGELTGGCCGLAGNFGFESGHYEVSAACAEEALLPSVREAPEDAIVLADGFSCRTQLHQLGAVRARHLAEVLAQALED